MDPTTTQLVTTLAVNYFTQFTADTVKNLFQSVFNNNPSLENDLKNAKTTQDIERVFQEAVGTIDAKASTGTIDVDNTFLKALRGIKFDHQNGKVTVAGTTMNAPILKTGGSGTGQTEISDSVLKSRGTEARIGKNAKITLTGGATMTQS